MVDAAEEGVVCNIREAPLPIYGQTQMIPRYQELFCKIDGFSRRGSASGAASRLNFKTSRVVEQLIPDFQLSCLLFK
jgi:hypothetical protein